LTVRELELEQARCNVAYARLKDSSKGRRKKAKKRKRKNKKRRKRKPDYETYIVSAAWYRRREWLRKQLGNRCCECKSTNKLTTHHKTYKNLGRETVDDVEILCWNCHKQRHPEKQLDQRLDLLIASDTTGDELFPDDSFPFGANKDIPRNRSADDVFLDQPFKYGQHKGDRNRDVPIPYLEWMASNGRGKYRKCGVYATKVLNARNA